MSNKLFVDIDLGLITLKECVRCGSTQRPIDEHHVTYNPEKKVYLCRPCHIGITVINGIYAQYFMSRITNTERQSLFNKFLKCKWCMSQEEVPIVKLRRRCGMVYKNRLKTLQKLFFGEELND